MAWYVCHILVKLEPGKQLTCAFPTTDSTGSHRRLHPRMLQTIMLQQMQ